MDKSAKGMTSYTNSFHNPKNNESKAVFTTDATPVTYREHLIYERARFCFDIVKDGVCIGMYAGINGAKGRIDNIVSPPHKTSKTK